MVSYLHVSLGVVVVSGTVDSVEGVVVEASESLVTAKDAPPTSEFNKSKCRGQCRHAPAYMNYVMSNTLASWTCLLEIG
jgi:hypothetical protein